MDNVIRRYRTFACVAWHKSYTKAAEELGCTPSTVSRMVASLEEHCGFPLFERRGGEQELSREGAQLLSDVELLLDDYERLQRRIEALRGPDAGCLAIAAPSSIVATQLAEPLGRLVAEHPGVSVELHETTYHDAVRLLAEGTVDLAFTAEGDRPAGMESEVFFRDELLVISRPGRFPAGERIPIASLIDEPFVADSETALLLQRELRHASVRCTTASMEAIIAMVEQGMGVSLVPELALVPSHANVQVNHLKRRAWRVIYLMRRPQAELPRVAQAFLDCLGAPGKAEAQPDAPGA